MSSALGVIKREGDTRCQPLIRGDAPSIIKRVLYIFNKKKHFQHTWCSFWWNSLITPSTAHLFKMCDQFCSQSPLVLWLKVSTIFSYTTNLESPKIGWHKLLL